MRHSRFISSIPLIVGLLAGLLFAILVVPHITARPTVTVMRLDHRPAIVDTMAGCVYENRAARISETGDHRRNDSCG
jgi:hypothetical protein